MKNTKRGADCDQFGLLIHDNNDTIARKHTDLMKKHHRSGTLWIDVENIIETPLSVNSQLTAMLQVADLCAYSLRRYCENKEEFLFNEIFKTADMNNCTDAAGGKAILDIVDALFIGEAFDADGDGDRIGQSFQSRQSETHGRLSIMSLRVWTNSSKPNVSNA